MGFIMEGILFLMMCIMGLMILGIALSPLYFAYPHKQKIWEFFYKRIPDKYRVLLRAEFTRRKIIKKIKQLRIENQSRGLIDKIQKLVRQELPMLLKNKAILTLSWQEADSAYKYHEESDNCRWPDLGQKADSFKHDLDRINFSTRDILLFLDRLSLDLGQLLIKGLTSGKQINELIGKAEDDIKQIIRSEEEVALVEMEVDKQGEGLKERTTAIKRQSPPRVAAK